MKTQDENGKKYRGCHKDCEGCIYQVKAVVGRGHGCWCQEWPQRCPIGIYWAEEQTIFIT